MIFLSLKVPFSSLQKFVYQAIKRKPLFYKLLQKAQLFNLYVISISSQPGTSLKAKTDIGPDKKWLGWHGGMGWRDTNSNQDDLALITTSDSNQSFFSQSLQVITHTLTKYFTKLIFIIDFIYRRNGEQRTQPPREEIGKQRMKTKSQTTLHLFLFC